MAKLNIEFMNDEIGFCSKAEDDLEKNIAGLIETYGEADMPWDQISKEEFEHLYIDRQFLLAWYPFKEGAEILEIGGGVGALTGLLCKRAKKVYTVEKKQNRAEIIKKRFENIQNLEVIHDNYMNLPYRKKFDYIVIHDIFGYVKKYIGAENPYQHFFAHLMEMLKDEGIILLATENRLGIKYFSGAIEDYSNKFFVGLDNFDGYDVIYTPTKRELEMMIEKCGLCHYKFYYPFPDNIFPTEIFTDDSLKYMLYGGRSEETGWDRFELFDEREMFETLQREGIVQDFANAFLVEISQKGELSPMSYCKLLGSMPDETFQYTSIIQDAYYTVNGMEYAIKGEGISLQRKLSDVMVRARHSGASAEKYCQHIYQCFKQIKEFLAEKGEDCPDLYTKAFTDNFGNDKLKKVGKCISFNEISAKDIFCGNNDYSIFLEENDCKVPVDYLIWSIVYEWYMENIWERKSRMKLVDLQKIYEICEISKEDVAVFQKWKNSYREKSSRRRVEEHYANWYKQDFIYPVDAIVNGDLIRHDFLVEKQDNSQLLLEKSILDEVR